jgi:hypothetical protein
MAFATCLGCGAASPAPVVPPPAPSASAAVAEPPAAAPPSTHVAALTDLVWAPNQTAIYFESGKPALSVRVDAAGQPRFGAFDVEVSHRILLDAEQQDIGRALLPLPARGKAHDEQDHAVVRFSVAGGGVRFAPRPSHLHDTIDARVLEDGQIRVRVRRQITDPRSEEQEAEGLFDPVHGRYDTMQWRLGGSLGTRWIQLSFQGGDDPYAADREEGRTGYDEFVAQRTPGSELLAAISARGEHAGDGRRFFALARPQAFWSRVAEASEEDRSAILGAEVPLCANAADVDTATLQKLLGKVKPAALDHDLIGCPDPRIARFLRPFARVPPRAPRNSDEERALNAWRSVRVADSVNGDVGAALRKSRPSAWFLDWLATLAPFTRAIDERARVAAVPALIDLMRGGHQPKSDSAVLRQLTLHDLGTDVERWDAYWAAHKDTPYVAWLVERVRAGAIDLRWLGYELLGRLPGQAASHVALVEALADPEPLVRVAAARGLALARDDGGAAVLIDALDDVEDLRAIAFDSLASLSDQPFGYAPRSDPRERQKAIGRWREWLRRRHPSP